MPPSPPETIELKRPKKGNVQLSGPEGALRVRHFLLIDVIYYHSNFPCIYSHRASLSFLFFGTNLHKMSWEDSEWEDFDRLLVEYRQRKAEAEAGAFYPCPPDPFGYVQTAVSSAKR